MSEYLLELKGLCKYYTGAQSVVVGLNTVDLGFRRGEFVAITGESGSGKSTLAHIISGILPYESGELLLEGRPTSHYDSSDWERYRREKISFISQSYGILPGSTVLGNVEAALRITGMAPAEAKTRAEELLKLVELWELRSRRAGKLSSGQKQRLSIARALAKPAPILVADEPTGNLDPENSAKVIELLAKAAQERLVILITHDFQEAEGCATRRIILQDGRVITDAALRPFAEAPKTERKKEKRKKLSPFVSKLQITGRPVWSALVLLFFALTAFGVFAFLGTFIVNLDDASTRIYDDSAFANGDKTRIVIQRLDSAGFTEEDYEALLSVKNADILERNSYLADWQYAWQQDVDYQLHYHVETVGSKDDNEKQLTASVELVTEKMDFAQTVPLLSGDREFLTAGRLPENLYEVVLAGSPDRIGETISVYLRDEKTMSVSSYIKLDVTVVGTTSQGTGVYFGEELSRAVNTYILNGGIEDGAYLLAPLEDGVPFITMAANVFSQTFDYETGSELTGKIHLHSTSCNQATEVPESLTGYLYGGYIEKLPVYIQRSADIPLENCVHTELENTNLVYTEPALDNWIGVYMESGEELPHYVLDREALAGSNPELTEAQMDRLQEALENIYYRVRKNESSARVVDMYLYSDAVCAVSSSLYARGGWSVGTENGYLNAVGKHDSTFVGYVLVTRSVFDQLVSTENPNQVSLFITDYAYTDQVIEDLQDLGYLAISPFRQGATQKNPTLAASRMKTLQVCLAALAAVVLLQLLVLRELFGVQNDSYKLLSDMGLGCATAKRSILWQVLIFGALGQALAFGAVQVCAANGVQRIQSILRYLPPANWGILSAVHLSLSLLAGLIIMNAMGRKVYPQSRDRGDLDLEEEGSL